MNRNSEKNIYWKRTNIKKMGWLTGPIFFVVAIIFVFLPESVDIPIISGINVISNPIAPVPIRQPLGDPPVAVVNNFERTCVECHKLFKSKSPNTARVNYHENIIMDHGANDQCINCHDYQDHNKLVLLGGKTILYSETVKLCSQCHGPTYRDWQKGMHGKTLGYWDISKGESRRLVCTECHDPHAPAYPVFPPFPGPNTLRMGDQIVPEEPGGRHNPLRTWSKIENQERR